MYDIEYATAQHEANMARLEATILLLPDSDQPRNRHLAKAVDSHVDDITIDLTNSIEALTVAVQRHYAHPADRPVPESNAQRAEYIAGLHERYVNHMNATFDKDFKFTGTSVYYTLMIEPITIKHAVKLLQTEVITREPGDDTRRAYRDALLATANHIPQTGPGLERLLQDEEVTENSALEAMRSRASQAFEETTAIAAVYTNEAKSAAAEEELK